MTYKAEVGTFSIGDGGRLDGEGEGKNGEDEEAVEGRHCRRASVTLKSVIES